MEAFHFVVDLFVHLDKHLAEIVAQYGAWTYGLLTLIVFAETGFVFTPFLPGDSLIFAAGALAAKAALNVWLLFVLLTAAAIVGDTVNYWIGHSFGALLLRRHSRWLKQEHIDQTHRFFEKYGGKTIVIARFVPFVRTFAPFVAGMGRMNYGFFIFYNVAGGILWVAACLVAGYAFGQIDFVKKHFSLVVLAIIAISLVPVVFTVISARREAKASLGAAAVSPAAPEEAG